jgi:Cdc6-like AAA superfamily ATPase
MPKPRAAEDWWQLSFDIGNLFTGAPIAEEELFAGRSKEVRQMLEAVLDRSRHVILYGERGVGKTSIANVFWKRYNKTLQTVIAARVQAHPADTFSSLWIKALEEFQSVGKQIGRSDLAPIDASYESVTPEIVRRELQKCRANAIPIIIIDEFDKLRDQGARELTANLIKELYDYSINATIILVGVAEDVSDLIRDHQSIRRALSQVKLERMSTPELNEIIDKRLRLTPLRISGDARWTIVMLSRGLPYYVHMLGKYASQNAVNSKRLGVGPEDVEAAMDKFVDESGQSFQDDYRTATESNQADNLFKEVLLACAIAPTDDSGFFTPTSIIEPLNAILKRTKRHAHFQRHLTEFMSDRRGAILLRRGNSRQYRYRFSDPMMQPYVIIKGIRDTMVDEETKTSLFHPEQPLLPIVSERPL